MSREVRRVPLGFDWPLNLPWEGYALPDFLQSVPCGHCSSGYSADGERLNGEWYGNRPFDPRSMGSEPFSADGPEAQAWAAKQLKNNPEFYGTTEEDLQREAERIVAHWNGAWMHHLTQDDVDALLAKDRLTDFTHDWDPEAGQWVARQGASRPTAREVNIWSLNGFGHDSFNAWICIEARAKREGVDLRCDRCKGRGVQEAFVGQRKLAKKWRPIKPPKGDAWQLWETVSEGSPVTPAFATSRELAEHIFEHPESAGWSREKITSVEHVLKWIENSGWAPSGLIMVKHHES